MINWRRFNWVVFALFPLLLTSFVQARPAISSIRDVRKLSLNADGKGRAVSVEGQVVRLNPNLNSFFMHDGDAGVFVRGPAVDSIVRRLKAGDVIVVTGQARLGGFAPDIQASSITVLGNKPRPLAREFREHEKKSPAVDCEWVSLRGRLISQVVPTGRKSIFLELERNQVVMDVEVPYSEENEKELAEKMFHYVDLKAVAGTVYNQSRQFVSRIFYANAAADFIVVDLDQKYEPHRVIQTQELMRYGQNLKIASKTVGTVTYATQREIYVRGEAASLKVFVKPDRRFHLGDQITLEGYVSPQPVSPAFRARSVEITGHNAVPDPMPVDVTSGVKPRWNYELVELTADLVELGRQFDVAGGQQETLLCRAGQELFEVRYPIGLQRNPELQLGAQLRLTGICHVLRGTERRWYMDVDGFWLQLRSGDDVRVWASAPWWTARRLVWSVGMLLCVLVLVLVWVYLLRKTVDKQTGIISQKIEQETLVNERQRIARELHDTQEQGLTALSLQLRNIQRKLETDPAGAPRSVVLAEQMLRVCREESRASIIDLRGGILEEMDLGSAIRKTIDALVNQTEIESFVEVRGTPVRLTLFAEHHLLRMATEATHNAIKHASPRHLWVELKYGPENFELVIRDDGCGFDPEAMPELGHFGLGGMQERANRLNGALTIKSSIGKGTVLSFSMVTDVFLKEIGHE